MVQLELTCRQVKYAKRAVGIARFVYNWLVANDQAGRDAGLWLTPHELEKEFNAAKKTNPGMGFVTQVSKFVARRAPAGTTAAPTPGGRTRPTSPLSTRKDAPAQAPSSQPRA